MTSSIRPNEPHLLLRGSTSRWIILAFLMAICFVSHFNRASITSAGDERIMAQYHISPPTMGAIYSSFLIVYTLFMIPGGLFLDRKGPRIALALMGLGSAVFCGFTGLLGLGFLSFVPIVAALFLVRSTMGLISAPLHPGAARAIGNWFPPTQAPLANGLVTGASILAYALVHPIFGALIDRIDWAYSFLLTGGITFALALAWSVIGRDRPPAPAPGDRTYRDTDAPTPAAESTASLASRSLVLLTLSYAAVGYFQYLFFYWLHFYFDQILHLEKDQSRLYASLPNLAMAMCMPLGGWVLGWWERTRGEGHRHWLPAAGMALSASCLLLGIASTQIGWVVALLTMALGFLGLTESAFWTTAVRLGGHRGGTTAAIMNTGGNGIGLLAPMLTPLIGEHLGWSWGLGLGAVVGFAGAACWFGITKEPRRT